MHDKITKTDITQPADIRMSQKIRSLPKIKPRARFRARVTLYSFFPSLAVRETSRTGRRAEVPPWRHSLGLRAAVYSGLALVVVFALFGGLTLASGSAVPGDALYSLKKLREGVELAFVDGAAKAEKNIQLAETRVAELDTLLNNKEVSPQKVESIVKDFQSKTQAAGQIIQEGKAGAEAPVIAAKLDNVTTQKENVVKRLTAMEPAGLLQAAAGARVSVASGGKVDTYTTDAGGKLAMTETPGAGAEAVVEADGRKQVLALSEEKPQELVAQASVKFEQPLDTLVVGKPQTATIGLTAADGTPLAMKSVVLRDRSGTTTIDGSAGDATVETGADGKVSFTLLKTSADRLTRIEAAVEDQPAPVLLPAVGGLELPQGASSCSVSARAFGPSDNLASIELDNGIVKVVLDRSATGRVVTAVTRNGVSSAPIEDPLATFPGAQTRARLSLTSMDSAAYELTVEAPLPAGTVKKTWTVGLRSGEDFARLSCSCVGVPASTVPDDKALETLNVDSPGSPITVSGQPVDPAAFARPETMSFSSANPYATVGSGALTTAVAVPLDSPAPLGWLVSSTGIGVRAAESTLSLGEARPQQFFLTVGDSKAAEALGRRAASGAGVDQKQVGADSAGEGFLLQVSEPGEKPTIAVYKKYKSVF